jgi:hypothetical protein
MEECIGSGIGTGELIYGMPLPGFQPSVGGRYMMLPSVTYLPLLSILALVGHMFV